MDDECFTIVILQSSLACSSPEYDNDSIETSNAPCGLDESVTAKRVSLFLAINPGISQKAFPSRSRRHPDLDPKRGRMSGGIDDWAMEDGDLSVADNLLICAQPLLLSETRDPSFRTGKIGKY